MTKRKYLKPHKLEVIAFVDGFCLMVYELIAARILTPYIGSSIYIWTSVIGVIIMALSLGYWAGGLVADNRNRPKDVAWLLLAVASGVTLTLLISHIVLPVIVEGFHDPRAQGLVSSFILFAPTSFLIGVVSPYLVKLRLHTLAQTGQTVAAISAFNAIGGILGTFLTGFFFFQFLGIKASLLLIISLLILTSWFIAPKVHIGRRLFVSCCIFICALLPQTSQAAAVAHIDTAFTHYEIKDVLYGGKNVRTIQTGPGGYQSGKNLSEPSELVFWYTQKMADIALSHPNPKKILIIGAGAFSLPQYLATKLPTSSIDVVDVDAQLLSIATQYFNYEKTKNVTFFAQDGRSFINNTPDKYDVVLIDAFSNVTIPFALTTREFGDSVHKIMTEQGTFAMNIIASKAQDSCGLLLEGIRNSVSPSNQPKQLVFSLPNREKERQNIILTFSLLANSESIRNHSKKEYVFTDDLAPIERLSFECFQQS